MKWLKKTETKDKEAPKEAPAKLRYSRYYEHDGALRSYANRAMLLAFVCVPTALIAVALAAYVRLQPPTVIRVDANGAAATVGDKSAAGKTAVNVAQGVNSEPTAFEKTAFVRLFLQRYLNFSPDSVNRNWADGLNMMTANLRRATMAALEKDNIVGKIQDQQITSLFHIRSLQPTKDDPLELTGFGVKAVHRVREHHNTTHH